MEEVEEAVFFLREISNRLRDLADEIDKYSERIRKDNDLAPMAWSINAIVSTLGNLRLDRVVRICLGRQTQEGKL